jgi:hypothetical protein
LRIREIGRRGDIRDNIKKRRRHLNLDSGKNSGDLNIVNKYFDIRGLLVFDSLGKSKYLCQNHINLAVFVPDIVKSKALKSEKDND